MDVTERVKLQLGELALQVIQLQAELETKDAIINELQSAIDESVEDKSRELKSVSN